MKVKLMIKPLNLKKKTSPSINQVQNLHHVKQKMKLNWVINLTFTQSALLIQQVKPANPKTKSHHKN